MSPPTPPACALGPVPVRLGATARLRRHEVVVACQVLADADRRLVAVGATAEAGALVRLAALLERRLARPGGATPPSR